MSARDASFWADKLERTLRRYDEELLRRVAVRLLRSRSHWPTDELIARCVATTSDVTVVERRLKDLERGERRLLAAIGQSRQPEWRLGNLVELMLALGEEDGLRPVLALLDAGLLYPSLPEQRGTRRSGLRSFEHWLSFGGPEGLHVFAHPLAMTRAIGEDLGLESPETVSASGPALEGDGLDWPLRLAVLWQRLAEVPLRRTQQGEFFKRDADRLDNDPLLNAPSDEGLPALPDAGYLAIALATLIGLVEESDGELRAAPFPAEWDESQAVLGSLFESLPRLRDWTPLDGWRPDQSAGNPFPSACLLALLLLARLPESAWTEPATLQQWIDEHHPFWANEDIRPSRRRDWMSAFLLGLAYQLRLVQAARTAEGGWAVRLSALGRTFLGLKESQTTPASFPRTLLVQPNLEIVAYRQGLTPGLVAFLARVATWQTLGSVCTLRLGPESTYRAMEGGLTFEEMSQRLEKHGTRPTPPAVIDSLRTWADKRDRITVYPAAALLEFASKDDLDSALARGFAGVRLADRLAVVASEEAIDYSMFRLMSSRDYASRPEQCVEVDEDGVTLTVDLTRSDLLLESELERFAEVVDRTGSAGQRRYRLTPASVRSARAAGLNPSLLEAWFQQRTGQAVSPAARLLLAAGAQSAPVLRAALVLHVATPELADGLVQWPATRELIAERLGPTALAIREENVEALKERLDQIDMSLNGTPRK